MKLLSAEVKPMDIWDEVVKSLSNLELRPEFLIEEVPAN